MCTVFLYCQVIAIAFEYFQSRMAVYLVLAIVQWSHNSFLCGVKMEKRRGTVIAVVSGIFIFNKSESSFLPVLLVFIIICYYQQLSNIQFPNCNTFIHVLYLVTCYT